MNVLWARIATRDVVLASDIDLAAGVRQEVVPMASMDDFRWLEVIAGDEYEMRLKVPRADVTGIVLTPGLYLVDDSTDDLYTVDPTTGRATRVGDLGVLAPTAMASHSVSSGGVSAAAGMRLDRGAARSLGLRSTSALRVRQVIGIP